MTILIPYDQASKLVVFVLAAWLVGPRMNQRVLSMEANFASDSSGGKALGRRKGDSSNIDREVNAGDRKRGGGRQGGAESHAGPTMVPPTGDSGPQPTNSQPTSSQTTVFSLETFQPTISSQSTRLGKRRRNGSYTAPISNPEFAAAADNGRVTTKEVKRLIEELKDIIHHQTSIIEATKADLLEVKTKQQALKSQNAELQDEIQALRAQINNLPPTNPRPPKTWAEVAAGGVPPNPSKPTQRESNCVRISTRHTPENNEDNPGFTRYLSADMANARIRSALLSTDTTRDVEVMGIGTTKTGYVIRFRDQQSAETARTNTEWLEELGNDTKLIEPRHGIVVHRTPTDAFPPLGNEKESIAKIMEENDLATRGYQIKEISWLKQKDKPLGQHGSLGIWFTSPEAAEWIINNGLIVGQRYIGSIEPYRVKKKRCHRCQRHRHLAWACKEDARCGYCAGTHERRHCPPEAAPRCLDCKEDHPTGDKTCRTPLDPPSSQ
jgi:hypothetical protein